MSMLYVLFGNRTLSGKWNKVSSPPALFSEAEIVGVVSVVKYIGTPAAVCSIGCAMYGMEDGDVN